MATSDKLAENYLTCTICAEVFTKPTALNCSHTFCRPCLVKYNKTQPDAIQAKFISCPSCRQFTRVTSPEKSVEYWVNQVKSCHHIQGLMEDFVPETTAIESVTSMCGMCKKKGKVTTPTFWCKDCEECLCVKCLKMHRLFSTISTHDVTVLATEGKKKKKPQFLCTEHKNTQVKLFCWDCNKAICHICCSIRHRQCRCVYTIETIMPEVISTLERKRNELGEQIQSERQQLSNQKDKMDKVTRNANTVEEEIKQASRDIHEKIRKKERKLLDDLVKLRDNQTEDLRAGMKTREINIQAHRQQFEYIDLTLKSESQTTMFVIDGSWTESADDSYKEEDIPTLDRIRFTQDKDQLRKTVGAIELGKVTFGNDVDYRASTLVWQETIDCKVKDDDSRPDIFDVVVLTLPDGKIIVAADFDNNTITMFYKLKSKSYTKSQKIDMFPRQIAKISDNEIAICGSWKVAFVKFNLDPVVTAIVDTERAYYGLSCLSFTHLLGAGNGCIDVLDRGGQVSKSISQLVKSARYVHVTKTKHILVSDEGNGSIVSLTREGRVNFTHSPTGYRSIKRPRGITTTRSGDILLADNENANIIQLTESGQFVRVLLSLDRPLRGLCLDEDDLVYVASRQYVEVFKFVKSTVPSKNVYSQMNRSRRFRLQRETHDMKHYDDEYQLS